MLYTPTLTPHMVPMYSLEILGVVASLDPEHVTYPLGPRVIPPQEQHVVVVQHDAGCFCTVINPDHHRGDARTKGIACALAFGETANECSSFNREGDRYSSSTREPVAVSA